MTRCAGLVAVGVVGWLLGPGATPIVSAAPTTQAAFTKEAQAALTPQAALERLKEGNARFTSGRMLSRDPRQRVAATAGGQFPFATVLSCIDSRSAPELVFDQGIGDLFSLRIAGNVVTDDMLGGLEFATRVAGSKLIVVLGHTECGAIKGACDRVQLGHLTGALAHLAPAVRDAAGDGAPSTSKDRAFVQKVADANVALAVRRIREGSPVMRELIDAGELKVVGAMLDISTGRVTFLDTP